ncbi:hypothetical protein H5410_010299 [Solanum commersonii]|uniref:AB hydrolase-1 domain-containing protein n=1 Tax=Solanum commersonii TaxID=4109 RepID=A0A9J6AKY9_SOLCO|nr:hypothetical protein H5410_010299 [Solanum commersonii]
MANNINVASFVLVHTGGHGAWSWYKIVELMKSSGHNVTALDLGASGNNPKQALDTDNAVLPELDNRVTYDNGPTNPPTTLILGPKYLATNVYQLSPIEDWTMATKLVRSLYLYRAEDVSKESTPQSTGHHNQVSDVILSGPNNFVLVHTGCRGAWSWYKIVELMTSSGHNVTAIDLGASGNNPKQALEIPSFFDYLSPLMEFMASLPAHKKIVLVGHSLGGLAISKAMETFPEKISSAVFVTALMRGPTLNASIVYTRDWTMATKLVRPLYLYHAENVSKEIVLSRKRYGSVRRMFIVATESKVFNKEFQRWMIENNPPNEVEEISGSDHMIMMSKPQQLFTTLLRIANK